MMKIGRYYAPSTKKKQEMTESPGHYDSATTKMFAPISPLYYRIRDNSLQEFLIVTWMIKHMQNINCLEIAKKCMYIHEFIVSYGIKNKRYETYYIIIVT